MRGSTSKATSLNIDKSISLDHYKMNEIIMEKRRTEVMTEAKKKSCLI